MAEWKIDVLFYGKITGPAQFVLAGLEEGQFANPYLGFLLRTQGRSVLVDCGVNDRFIVDGKAWGDFLRRQADPSCCGHWRKMVLLRTRLKW